MIQTAATPSKRTLALAGSGSIVLAAPASLALNAIPDVQRWNAMVAVRTDNLHDGGWLVVRDGLAYVAIPILLLLAGIMVLACARRSPRQAILLAAHLLGANLTVQLLKHVPPAAQPLLAPLDPLSGHVGVVAATCLGWLVVAPPRWRAPSAAAGLVAVSGVTFGVVLASWHSVPQVFCPLLVCVGWALLLAAVERRPPDEPLVRGRRCALGLPTLTIAVGIAILVAVAVLVPRVGSFSSDFAFNEAVWLAVAACLGGCAIAFGVVAGSVVALAPSPST